MTQSGELQLLLQLFLCVGTQQEGKCAPQPEQNKPWNLKIKASRVEAFSDAFIPSV